MPSIKIPNGSGGWIKIPTVKGDAGTITSVVLTSGNHAAGTTDTYTITYNDNSTTTFTVYNGADGAGAGDMVKTVYDPNAKNADAFSMANMVEGTTNKILTATERTKLDGIATGATANSTDATLLARANHTGTQLKSTISDFPTEMTPASHTHGNITNDGKIGSTADLPVFTTTAGAVGTKSIADAKTLLGIAAGAQITTGTYTGTGTNGSTNENSLTVPANAKIVIIQSNGGSLGFAVISISALTSSYVEKRALFISTSNIVYSNSYTKLSGTTLSWYNSSSPAQQLNESGTVYTYTIISG